MVRKLKQGCTVTARGHGDMKTWLLHSTAQIQTYAEGSYFCHTFQTSILETVMELVHAVTYAKQPVNVQHVCHLNNNSY